MMEHPQSAHPPWFLGVPIRTRSSAPCARQHPLFKAFVSAAMAQRANDAAEGRRGIVGGGMKLADLRSDDRPFFLIGRASSESEQLQRRSEFKRLRRLFVHLESSLTSERQLGPQVSAASEKRELHPEQKCGDQIGVTLTRVTGDAATGMRSLRSAGRR